MKKVCWVTPDEAKALSITPKPPEKNRRKFRATLDYFQQQELRKIKHKGVYDYCKSRGIDFDNVRQYWDKTKEYKLDQKLFHTQIYQNKLYLKWINILRLTKKLKE